MQKQPWRQAPGPEGPCRPAACLARAQSPALTTMMMRRLLALQRPQQLGQQSQEQAMKRTRVPGPGRGLPTAAAAARALVRGKELQLERVLRHLV